MGIMKKNAGSFIILCMVGVALCSTTAAAAARPARAIHNITAVFAFGDSTLDTGNNNYIQTIVKANHTPYGRDFPGQVPTGRFSNGKLIPDFLVSALGLKPSLPPYSAPNLTASDLLTGVCFASAGTGLDRLTAMSSFTTTMESQVRSFEAYLRELTGLVGRDKARHVVRDALFVISSGSNDMIRYYSFPTAATSLDGYHDFLIARMHTLVLRLISLGGRRFTIAGLPPLGCVPIQMTLDGLSRGLALPATLTNRSCVLHQNSDAVLYNSKLQPLINTIRYLFRPKIAYVDIYNPLMDMIHNPDKYGFVETKLGCCGLGGLEMGPVCGLLNPFTHVCRNTSKYLFWDSVHPTQATYQALADQMMKTVLSDIMK